MIIAANRRRCRRLLFARTFRDDEGRSSGTNVPAEPTTRKRFDVFDGGKIVRYGETLRSIAKNAGTNRAARLCFDTIFQLIGIVADFLCRVGMFTRNRVLVLVRT